MKKKYCLTISDECMIMLEDLTNIILPYNKKSSKSFATEYCIRSVYGAIKKVKEELLCREEEPTKQQTKSTSRTQQTKSKL